MFCISKSACLQRLSDRKWKYRAEIDLDFEITFISIGWLSRNSREIKWFMEMIEKSSIVWLLYFQLTAELVLSKAREISSSFRTQRGGSRLLRKKWFNQQRPFIFILSAGDNGTYLISRFDDTVSHPPSLNKIAQRINQTTQSRAQIKRLNFW